MKIFKNGLNSVMAGLLSTGLFFILITGTVWAEQSFPSQPTQPDIGEFPNLPSQPSMPDQPELPPQPDLPPCPECDDFDSGPTITVTPTNSPQPTDSPAVGGNGDDGGSSSSSSESSSSSDGQGGGGEVLSLSKTSSENRYGVYLGFLGIFLIILGLRLKVRNTKDYIL